MWHRRAGKDSTAINLTVTKMVQRVGTYWHLLPTNVQARRVVWNESDGQGRRIIDQAMPPELREGKSEADMSIRLKNGSLWQLGGSDNYDSMVGSNVRGVVFSEWALCDPAAWDYIRPILVENDGWALFIYTPRGRNHGYDLYERVKGNARWHVSLLDISKTKREDGVTPIVTEQMVEDEINEGMDKARAAQEFHCSFAAGVVGAFFAEQIERATEDGRVGKVPHDRRLAVHCYFDIGLDDATSVWFIQRHGYARKVIRYMEWSNTPFFDVCEELAALNDYRIAVLHLPHDGKRRDIGTGKKLSQYAADAFEAAGKEVLVEAPKAARDKQTGIELGRLLITQAYFDKDNCKRGLDCLMNYRRVFDEKRKTYQDQPYHDWASHGADAWIEAGWDDSEEPMVENVEQTFAKPKVHRSLSWGT